MDQYKTGQLKMLDRDFLDEFKRATETNWSEKTIDPTLYGFQFQSGTRWNPGLSEDALEEYQHEVGVPFPDDFVTLLRKMNGTDLPTLNLYGSSGLPAQESVGVYSYPRDIAIVRRRIEEVREARDKIADELLEQGFHLADQAGLVPFFAHRYILCQPGLQTSAVLSIVLNDDGADVIVYGNCLKDYLQREFLTV